MPENKLNTLSIAALPLTAIYSVACMAYRMILRPLLKEAIDNPDKEWDDMVVKITDAIFNYSE